MSRIIIDLDIEVKIGQAGLSLMDTDSAQAGVSEVVLELDPDRLERHRVHTGALQELRRGEVLFEVECFSLTANNFTYASELGRRIGYWNLFPAEPPWGRLPAWGYIRAVRSRHDEVATGARFYGFCPPGSHVVMSPQKVSSAGFGDGAPHRAALGPVYNAYSSLETDPGYTAEIADRLLVLRPLFWLSFMLVDHLEQNGLLDRQIVLTSASSKAGVGVAHLLSALGVDCVGVTSAANHAFVRRLGLCSAVFEYGDLGSIPTRQTVLLDLAGDPESRSALASHLGGSLSQEILAGFTHRGAAGAAAPPTDLFFVPDQMRNRAKQQGWATLNERFCRALTDFAQASEWLQIKLGYGPEAVVAAYQDTLANRNAPSSGRILSLSVSDER
jgi:hypothetical protein